MHAPWYSVATHFKGLTEVHGSVDNPKIVEMFRISGHPEVKDDETPWCAAFVGACLRLSGYSSSGELGARSYLHFGEDLHGSPERGCIVVFWRGDPNAQTGHVAFYDRDDGTDIVVLGGNQSDAVTTQSYPKKRVLAYRRPQETASLPTETTLPNILAIDPANAPPHVLDLAARPAPGAEPPREPRATPDLDQGATGFRVRMLQTLLDARGLQLGEIDGDYGPRTAAAVSQFQRFQHLPVTGIADAETLRALGMLATEATPQTLPIVVPKEPAKDGAAGGAPMDQQDILKTVFAALMRGQQPASTGGPVKSSSPDDTAQLLQTVLAALTGRPVAASPGSPTGTAPATLTPIDKLLGGEALAGKKTPLAIIAYAFLSILQAVDVAGTFSGDTKTTTGQILTALIASFGGLGVLSKIDRVVKMLGIIAAKPPG
jgi:uncharacterized protein (TIGR02594 family)